MMRSHGVCVLLCMSLALTGCSKDKAATIPGGVTTVLTPDRANPPAAALSTAARILRSRLQAAGGPSRVEVVGGHIRVTAPEALTARLPAVTAPARLEFRRVLECGSDVEGGGCGSSRSASPHGMSGDPYSRAAFAALDCSDPLARGGSAEVRPTQQIVACTKDGTEKLHLDIAKVNGTDVKSAGVGKDSFGSTPLIDLDFTPAGQERWTALTVDACGAADARGGQCPNAGSPTNRIAVLVDGVVYSAPSINEPIRGAAQISGNFTDAEAKALVDLLRFGALPFGFTLGGTR